ACKRARELAPKRRCIAGAHDSDHVARKQQDISEHRYDRRRRIERRQTRRIVRLDACDEAAAEPGEMLDLASNVGFRRQLSRVASAATDQMRKLGERRACRAKSCEKGPERGATYIRRAREPQPGAAFSVGKFAPLRHKSAFRTNTRLVTCDQPTDVFAMHE